MPHRALTVTSTTNFHALGNYFGLAILGAGYFVNPRIQAIDDMIGARYASIVMGLMMMCGIMGFVVALVAKKRRDPSVVLLMESVIAATAALDLGFVIVAMLIKYGPIVAMITSILIGSWMIGCSGRAIQGFWELAKLNKVRKMPVQTVEVPAEPDKG